jgi:glycosyltransferase involved in cell wall biosynthesis
VAYNVINPTHLRQKGDYGLHRPVRVVSVGRLIPKKSPAQLIEAIGSLSDINLTIVGDGPDRDSLRAGVAAADLGSRITFMPAVANDKLCGMLADFDIFAVRSDYWELSKSVLEALLTGLPAIISRRPGQPVPELADDICVLVDNTPEAYRAALNGLISNDVKREQLGRGAFAHARANWAPETTEAVFVDVYRNLLAARSGDMR